MSEDCLNSVIGIITDILNAEPGEVSRDTLRTDVDGWDSMQNLNIVLAIEQEFGISLPGEAIAEIEGVQSLVAWIDRFGK